METNRKIIKRRKIKKPAHRILKHKLKFYLREYWQEMIVVVLLLIVIISSLVFLGYSLLNLSLPKDQENITDPAK